MDSENNSDGIAIIGLSGRFPGAGNVIQFWENLRAGKESIATFTDDELLAAGVTKEEFSDPSYVRRRGVLDEPEWFDNGFFGMTPREAELTDPQHRMFLECCQEALEDSGHVPGEPASVTGVFAAASLNTYWLRQVLGNGGTIADFTKAFQVDSYNILLGADKDYLATRVAYKLDLRGPAMTIQTACSSSLVAVAQACASLQSYQSDVALAGGVSISFPQERGHIYQEGAIPSADGHCRAFDADATGTVFGAGCGVVVLKRLEEALQDGDFVYAVIRGAAVNNDGGDKMSYSAPSQTGQAEVIALAHALADVSAESISYVEAHGTGTPLGDPIEVAALTQAFRMGTDRKSFCGLGSLKTNVGHLEAAAGVTGLIKTALALKQRFLPASLHFKVPNPNIDFANSPFFVVADPNSWENVPLPRRAGVSSFGVGGTNAHVVVEEPPPPTASSASRPQQLLVLSAKTPTALDAMSCNLADWLESPPSPLLDSNFQIPPALLADVAFTLHRGRTPYAHRRAWVVADVADAIAKLRSGDKKPLISGQLPPQEPSVVFLFPGQGSQYVGMGRELYEKERVFRAEVDRCAGILLEPLGTDIRECLYPSNANHIDAEKRINETAITQPAIFVVEYALARLWISWGVKPAALVGHSIGEYVCAVLAGSCALEDALALLVTRARLMQALPPGSMLAVRLGESELEPMLPEKVSIAAVNSPKLCTVSGPTDLLQRFKEELETNKVPTRFLPTSHAFHSSMMDPMLPAFTEAAEKVSFQDPKIPWISTCTGERMNLQTLQGSGYWARQLRNSVRFTSALDTLALDSAHLFIEVGPGQALTQLARQHPSGRASGSVIFSSLGAGSKDGDEQSFMLQGLGRSWIGGVTPDWESFYADEKRRRLPLPTYPFERRRCWTQPPRSSVDVPASAEMAEDHPSQIDQLMREQLRMMDQQLDQMVSSNRSS